MKTIYETDIEKIVREELERRGFVKGIDFATQYPLRYSFIIDFAFPDQRIAIEADGSFWHGRTPKQRQKDYFKTKILKDLGWNLYRFKEVDIKNNIVRCIDKIEFIL
jgi:very-short-patch-repair endonuclease